MAETAGCADALSAEDPGEAIRSKFFAFASDDGEPFQLSIDFSSGAIDAQESVNGGILLVVTGHVYLPKRTGFVHTFFLDNAAVGMGGRKKVFYVRNDVLRFLGEDRHEEEGGAEGMNGETALEETVTMEAEEAMDVPEEELMEEPVVEMPAMEQQEEEVLVIPDETESPTAEETKMDIIDNLEQDTLNIAEDEPAAEESKMDFINDTSMEVEDQSSPDSPASKGSDSKHRSKRSRRKKGKSSRSNSPADQDKNNDSQTTEQEKPKTPGSWASLVATGQPKKSGRKSSPKSRREDANTNAATTKTSTASNVNHEKAPQDRTTVKESAPTSTATSNTRTPEATLFIRNVPDATKESEIRSLFEAIAASSGNKILGITLNPNRGFCFVDFDSVAAVDAVVAEAEKSLVKEPRTGRKVSSSFMVHGRVLDVERKVKENNNRGSGGGGGYRGSRGRAGMRRSPPRGR